jgi:hypothetical protein
MFEAKKDGITEKYKKLHADPTTRAVRGEDFPLIARWDCGLDSHLGH